MGPVGHTHSCFLHHPCHGEKRKEESPVQIQASGVAASPKRNGTVRLPQHLQSRIYTEQVKENRALRPSTSPEGRAKDQTLAGRVWRKASGVSGDTPPPGPRVRQCSAEALCGRASPSPLQQAALACAPRLHSTCALRQGALETRLHPTWHSNDVPLTCKGSREQ